MQPSTYQEKTQKGFATKRALLHWTTQFFRCEVFERKPRCELSYSYHEASHSHLQARALQCVSTVKDAFINFNFSAWIIINDLVGHT